MEWKGCSKVTLDYKVVLLQRPTAVSGTSEKGALIRGTTDNMMDR